MEVHPDDGTLHELEDAWTLWFQKQAESGTVQGAKWLESLREVMTFGTIEEFWRMYNNIKTPSDMPPGTDYAVFKNGVEPKWEDPEHLSGGSFTVNLTGGVTPDVINKMWLYCLLACIGADFGHEEYESITGIYLSIRKGRVRIALWCRSSDDSKTKRMGERFQTILDELYKPCKVVFAAFQSSPAGGYSSPNPKSKKGYGGGGGYTPSIHSKNNNNERDLLKSSTEGF